MDVVFLIVPSVMGPYRQEKTWRVLVAARLYRALLSAFSIKT